MLRASCTTQIVLAYRGRAPSYLHDVRIAVQKPRGLAVTCTDMRRGTRETQLEERNVGDSRDGDGRVAEGKKKRSLLFRMTYQDPAASVIAGPRVCGTGVVPQQPQQNKSFTRGVHIALTGLSAPLSRRCRIRHGRLSQSRTSESVTDRTDHHVTPAVT